MTLDVCCWRLHREVNVLNLNTGNDRFFLTVPTQLDTTGKLIKFRSEI